VNLTALTAEVRDGLHVLATEKKQTIGLFGGDSITATADRVLSRNVLVNSHGSR